MERSLETPQDNKTRHTCVHDGQRLAPADAALRVELGKRVEEDLRRGHRHAHQVAPAAGDAHRQPAPADAAALRPRRVPARHAPRAPLPRGRDEHAAVGRRRHRGHAQQLRDRLVRQLLLLLLLPGGLGAAPPASACAPAPTRGSAAQLVVHAARLPMLVQPQPVHGEARDRVGPAPAARPSVATRAGGHHPHAALAPVPVPVGVRARHLPAPTALLLLLLAVQPQADAARAGVPPVAADLGHAAQAARALARVGVRQLLLHVVLNHPRLDPLRRAPRRPPVAVRPATLLRRGRLLLLLFLPLLLVHPRGRRLLDRQRRRLLVHLHHRSTCGLGWGRGSCELL